MDNIRQTNIRNLKDMTDSEKYDFQKAFEKQFTLENILHLSNKFPNDQDFGGKVRAIIRDHENRKD